MNSIIKTFDKTDWRPTFYGIQDRDVFGAMEELIKSTLSENVFVADIGRVLRKILYMPEDFVLHRIIEVTAEASVSSFVPFGQNEENYV